MVQVFWNGIKFGLTILGFFALLLLASFAGFQFLP